MRGRSGPSWIVEMLPKCLDKHLLPAMLAGFALRLFFIWHFPFYSGDTAYYEELARNWLYHGVYGFYSHGQLLPSDARAPGYPAFLAAIYFLAGTGRRAVMLAQAFVDLATCVLAAGIAPRFATGAPDPAPTPVAAAALLLPGLCPFTAHYTAGAAHGVLGTIFHYARAADSCFASRNGNRPHFLKPRTAPRCKNLVRGWTRGWPRHASPSGNAVASGSRSDFPVAPLSPSRELEKTRACNSVDD